jgi:hypothetical protein
MFLTRRETLRTQFAFADFPSVGERFQPPLQHRNGQRLALHRARCEWTKLFVRCDGAGEPRRATDAVAFGDLALAWL